jgi:predicted phosphodiesterase
MFWEDYEIAKPGEDTGEGSMRVALIADVHGNSIAMDAVAADLARIEPDEIVFLGDAATNGFDPHGAVQRLRSLGCRMVRGNTDADILDTPAFYYPPRRHELPDDAQRVLEISLWANEQLGYADRALLQSTASTITLDLPGGRQMVCFHGSPRSPTDVITSTTPEGDLRPMFQGRTASVLAGGHTHVPLLRRVMNTTVINPGSVGLPFACYGSGGARPVVPRAQYAVTDVGEQRVEILFREVPLNVAEIRDAALASGMPHAKWWGSLWAGE